MGAVTNRMSFRTGVNNVLNEPTLEVLVQGQSGQPCRVTITDAESGEPEMVFILPADVAGNLATAFGLAANIEQTDARADLFGRND